MLSKFLSHGVEFFVIIGRKHNFYFRGNKLVCNLNIIYRNLKSENSQDYCMPRNLNEIVRT